MKRIIRLIILTSIILATISLSPSNGHAQCNGKTLPCSDAAKCKPASDGKNFYTKSSSQVDTQCVKNSTKNSCHNAYPMGNINGGSYNRVGWRMRPLEPKKNEKQYKGNHYGSDLGCHGLTNVQALAPAPGVIKKWAWGGGSGRTLIIEHTKQCTPSQKESKVYSSIFRHLFKVNKESGAVAKNEVVGIVGGSNYFHAIKNRPALMCDNPKHGGKCKKDQYFPIHLHWEVIDGSITASSSSVVNRTIYEPYCSAMSVFCGDCPNAEADKCTGANGSVDASGSGGFKGDNGASGNASGDNGASGEIAGQSTCELGEYLDSESCLFCNMFKVIFNAASTMAKTANDKLSAPSKDLVIIGFGIWLAIYLLKKMATFQSVKSGEMVKDMLFQGFRVLLVTLILSGSLYAVLDLTLNPVMQTGLSFSQSLNSNSSCDNGADYMKDIIGYETSQGYQQSSKGGLSIDLGRSILCSIKNLEDSVGFLMGLGNYSMCLSWSDAHNILYVLPHLGYFTSGAVLWIAGALILIALPWTLIDCILQLCIAAALIPCAIAAFAFKITSKYIKVIWNFFMNAMFNIVFLSIIIYIINKMLKEQIGFSEETSITDDTVFITATGNGLAWWGIGALKIFTTCFFFRCFFDEAKSMADRFANSAGLGGSKGIGRMIGGTFAQMGEKYVAKPVLKMGGEIAKATGESINSAVGNSFRSGVNHMKGRALLGASRIGLIKTEVSKDENGNTTGYKSSFNVLGFKQTREVTKDENGVWTHSKETHQRSTVEKAFREGVDENGNKVYMTQDGRAMQGVVDQETGNVVYSTEDGRSKLTTNSEGKILSYKRDQDKNERKAVTHGGVKVINDGFMKTRVLTDQNNNVIKTETQFKNTTAKYLVNQDGTTNMHAYNQMINGAQNKEMASVALVGMHMKERGMKLENSFAKQDVKIEKDGSILIKQTHNNGSEQIIKAKMIGNQMVIENSVTDTNGNTSRSLSNGIQTRNDYFHKQSNGNYKVTTKYSFSEQTNRASNITAPLSSDGTWGHNVDAQKAMVGFDAVDLENHKIQIKNKEILNTIIDSQTQEDAKKSSKTINFEKLFGNSQTERTNAEQTITTADNNKREGTTKKE